jgi:phage terminase large subunit-like protein
LGNLTRAERNIAWCEKFIRIPEGKFVGQPLKMAGFMKDDFRAIYENPAGTRRAIISRGRKNAKTTESAMILLLHLCGPEAQPNSQLFSAAQSRDQAAVLFALAAKMVRLSPELNDVVTVRDTAKQLFCGDLGTLYRALSAEASTAYGLSPALTIHDELGQVRGPRSELYEALETATAAQASPMSIIISTQAPNPGDLLSVLIDDAQTGRDPTTVLRFQSAGDGLDPFSVEAIKAANPAFEIFMNQQAVLDMMENARAMPSRQPEYENLVLNRRVEMLSPFIDAGTWKANGGAVEEFTGPVYAGLDLSAARDLTAFVMIGQVGDKWHVKPVFWLPGEGLREKAAQDRVPYDVWAKNGFLETTPGRAVEYEYVARIIADYVQRYDIRKIAFDRWGFMHLKPWLAKAGFRDDQLEGDAALFEEFGQGTKSMTPALRVLETDLLERRFAHGNHPILEWNAKNATVVGSDDNRKLDKPKDRTRRIDGLVALTMARAVAGTYQAGSEGSMDDYFASLAGAA